MTRPTSRSVWGTSTACRASASSTTTSPRGAEAARSHVIVAGDLCWTPRPGVPGPAELTECPGQPSLLSSLLRTSASPTSRRRSPTSPADREVRAAVRSAPSFAGVVRQGGFGAVGLANNHAGDFGPRGVIDTLDNCRAAGLLTVGAGADARPRRRPFSSS